MQEICRWLEKVKKLDELIKAKVAERDQLWALATQIVPNMDGMPHAPGVKDKVGDCVARMVDVARATDVLVDQYIEHRQEVLRVLEQLPANEFGALHRHYIQYMTWDEVAADMGVCVMTVFRYKRSGLKTLKMLLNVSMV